MVCGSVKAEKDLVWVKEVRLREDIGSNESSCHGIDQG